MGFTDRFERTFRYLLPSPFSIALVLTAITFFVALITTLPQQMSFGAYAIDLGVFWQNGLWNGPLMIFAMQMMLMLVLGHTLALSKPVHLFIGRITNRISNNASAAFWVTLLTLCVSFFNWGLGLIFGAIFARKIGEHALQKGIKLNYPLIGAAGYSGLMVWHGGISGSAPIKVNDPGHIREIMQGSVSESAIQNLPINIPIEATIFSPMNIWAVIILLIVLPLFMRFLGQRTPLRPFAFPIRIRETEVESKPSGAEKIDLSNWIGKSFGLLIVILSIYLALYRNPNGGLSFLTPNYINLVLLGLSLTLHKNIQQFLNAVDEAIGGAAGILIQFPLYFGIMGIMKDAGLVALIANWLSANATATSFPILTFFASGIINIFVPSGGGQWAIQAPVLIQTATELNVPLSKAVMSLAYGDQLTNMLQPFWALPLLGITGLKAKEILPYTLMLMLLGTLIFVSILLFF